MCFDICIDCCLEQWMVCFWPSLAKHRKKPKDESELEHVYVRQRVDGKVVRSIDTRPVRRSQTVNRGTSRLPPGVTVNAGRAREQSRANESRDRRQVRSDSNQNEATDNTSNDRPHRDRRNTIDAGVQTTDSLLNVTAGPAKSRSKDQRNQRDDTHRGRNKDWDQENNQDSDDNNQGKNKNWNQETDRGGKKSKYDKRAKLKTQESDSQEESSKVNDRSDDTMDKTKGKAKAKDDNKSHNLGTNDQKNVDFSGDHKDKKDEKKNEDTEASPAAEAIDDWPVLPENESKSPEAEAFTAAELIDDWPVVPENDSKSPEAEATPAAEVIDDWPVVPENDSKAPDPATNAWNDWNTSEWNTGDWNTGETGVDNVKCKNSQSPTQARSPDTPWQRRGYFSELPWIRSYRETECRTRPMSCIPIQGIDGEYRFWVCDASGEFRLRSRAEIDEQYQPGHWVEDEWGWEYFKTYTYQKV
ncbi:hypothetical protein TSTA_116530 [Talaromyces stipitatus ATCC 10500]|uniref:Uncharacterized protein n=1 Tax=Talaromyces stipitatus (strain ATCC 10500 / CBS 375.48 / QM 6759 / NRRL 1006) TaxID=441959 RepID=B8MBJ9_TALSN|nr:uncharacterized protein TSTA_116530 [Talaromyces stipitatus ATCC 10500]EED17863.1 hypothetical protein TSTA_116530 [Talaromyces stipitatus ATCC 10500]